MVFKDIYMLDDHYGSAHPLLCPTCLTVWDNNIELMEHMESHKPAKTTRTVDNYVCHLCGAQFDDTIKFNSHLAICKETTNLIAVEDVPHEDDFQINPGNLNESINPVNEADKIEQVISQTL